MKQILLISVFVFNALCTSAQWQQATGVWGGEMASIISMGDKIIATTEQGSVYVSSNNGLSWLETTPSLGSITYLRKAGKYIYANYDEFFRSADSGLTWTHLSSFPNIGRNIYPIGDSCIAKKYPHELLCFTDSGANWHPIDVGLDYVECLAEGNSAVYAGCNGGLYVSYDGMNSWTSLDSAFLGVAVWDVMVDDSVIIAATSSGLRRSGDYGASWTIIDPDWTNTIEKWNSMYFYRSFQNLLFMSADKGISWDTCYSETTVRSYPVFAESGAHLFIGSDLGVRKSMDGTAWAEADSLISWQHTYGVFRCGPFLFAMEENGQYLRSSDQGMHWSRMELPFNGHVLLAAEADTLYGVFRDEGVYVSYDQGENWTVILRHPKTVTAIKRGCKYVVVTDPDTIYATTNNGLSWNKSTPLYPVIDNFSFIGEYQGNLYGCRGVYELGIYRSTDWGLTWSVSEADLSIIHFEESGGRFFAGAYYGNLYETLDNGLTWNLVHAPDPGFIHCTDVHAEGSELWTTDDGGLIYSPDNGLSWTNIDPEVPWNLNTFYISDSLIVGTSHRGIWYASRTSLVDVAATEMIIQDVDLYPNPSSGMFNLRFDAPATGTVCVYDLLGNCLLTKDFRNSATEQIDLANAVRGIYFVEVRAGDEKRVQKVIIN